MIEGPCIPLDQGKILAIVFRVTLHAFLTGASGQVVRSVQSLSRRDAGRDLVVAIHTSERGLAAS